MSRFKQFAGFVLCMFSMLSCADMTVVSVDTNNVANVDSIGVDSASIGSASIGTAVLSDDLSVDSTGVAYVSSDDKTMTFTWPTNYVYAYTNYPGRFDNYIDPLATEWYVNKSVQGLKADLLVFGDKTFYARYTNSPPSDIESMLGYVSNCVYLLSNVRVEVSYTSLSNELDQLKTRVTRTERTADRFGFGVNDLDYIINSDISDMDAENMLDMIKALATYIKYGRTNSVDVVTANEAEGE